MSSFINEDDAATAAVLSMLLEVSGNPKAGNVDREHNFPDLRYEHFLASSASAHLVFKKAAVKKEKIGKLVLEAVKTTNRWCFTKNIHFGAFLLLIPLLYCWKGSNAEEIAIGAREEIKKTSVDDSLAILQAFKISSVRVMEAEKLSLNAKDIAEQLRRNNINLYRWMLMAPRHNLIARELTNGFKESLKGKDILLDFFTEREDINAAIVLTYHTLLSEHLDSLIISKHGEYVAKEVREFARKVLSNRDISRLKELDEELIRRRINPGTIADLTASSIFLAFAEGLRF
jgi:triphosphoribosyl-dephospho-CoA synthase